MGALDLPAPLFAWADNFVANILPPGGRLVIWAALAALASMELYRIVSPQKRLTRLKAAIQAAQRRLADYDGSFDGAGPLIGRVLSLALRRVALVLPATLLAALPIVMLCIWLDAAYGRVFPEPGQPVAVAAPSGFEGRWSRDGSGPPRVRVVDAQGGTVADVTVDAPVPVLHKRAWWNLLLANPAGYLPDNGPVERVEIDLPRLELHRMGPAWLRGWEPVFILALLLFAIPLKIARRIE